LDGEKGEKDDGDAHELGDDCGEHLDCACFVCNTPCEVRWLLS